ncbi:MAG: hypothetical protein KatS3mg002_1376 [Candidatus Woesearchaeota archaeon]|nr:MAG: hypothetical protein KatS3mg002_1376 [Candidatus Woesearchaeota archaeon]
MSVRRSSEKTYIFKYDVSGGDKATGTVTLGSLPSNFVITQAWIHVLTTFTSATDAATIALGYTGATDAFDAAIAISNASNPWDAGAPRTSDVAADGAVGNFVTTAAGDDVLATVAVETLTAGKLLLVIKGYVAF